jgi:hypothetical protein
MRLSYNSILNGDHKIQDLSFSLSFSESRTIIPEEISLWHAPTEGKMGRGGEEEVDGGLVGG